MLALHSAAALAQNALPNGRPPREDGPIVRTPPTRATPSAERALLAAHAQRTETVGPPRWGLGAVAFALVSGIGLALTWQLTQPRGRRTMRAAPRAGLSLHPGIEVRALVIAVDWSRRAAIDATLGAVLARADLQTCAGQHTMLATVRDAFATEHVGIRAAAMQAWTTDPAAGPALFEQVLGTTNYRAQAASQSATPGGHDRVAVLSLVVATRCPLPPVPARVDVTAVLRALEALVPPKPEMLAGASALWTPFAPAYGLDAAALRVQFPEAVAVGGAPSSRPVA